MEQLIKSAHGVSTLFLLLLYLALTIRLYKRRPGHIGGLNLVLAQFARFTLLVVYLSGLFLTITLNKLVHNVHHILSALPVVVFFIIPILVGRAKEENKNRIYALMFALLFFLILIAGLSSHLSILPKL